MSKNFHALTVSDIKRETSEAVSLTFDIPEDLKETFQFIQGQYLTLKFDLTSLLSGLKGFNTLAFFTVR